MIKPGLVSVTFRKLEPSAVIDVAVQAEIEAIEWGGDIHVPHGDLKTAKIVGQMTTDAGLAVASYGSYYIVGNDAAMPFECVLSTAIELGAPSVRVWAGNRGSAAADQGYREIIASESRRIAELAAKAGLAISYEFHSGSLTDTAASAVALLEAVSHDSIGIYWQPPVGMQPDLCLSGLNEILPWLTNIHVFHWYPTSAERHALSLGRKQWLRYLTAASSTEKDRYAMIEFVKDDSIDNFLQDAAELKNLFGRAQSNNLLEQA